MAAITTERQEAILALVNDVALERNQLLRDVEAQRLATLQWATGERRETIEDVRRVPGGSRERPAYRADRPHRGGASLNRRGDAPHGVVRHRRGGARAARRSRVYALGVATEQAVGLFLTP